jgi:hypothetical protein
MPGEDEPEDIEGPAPDWREALDGLERSLREASWSLALLRRALDAGPAQPEARVPRLVPRGEKPAPPALDPEAAPGSPFERLWERVEQEHAEKESGGGQAPVKQRRGLDLLPQQYSLTVEDREGRVDLVPLHRALQGVAGVQELTLASFANGVPVISLRLEGEMDFDRLQQVVSVAMQRDCELIKQENNRLHLRLRTHAEVRGD